MGALCECYNGGCEKITEEEYQYLSNYNDGIYHRHGYYILTIKCAELEVAKGESEIITAYGNAALTKYKLTVV